MPQILSFFLGRLVVNSYCFPAFVNSRNCSGTNPFKQFFPQSQAVSLHSRADCGAAKDLTGSLYRSLELSAQWFTPFWYSVPQILDILASHNFDFCFYLLSDTTGLFWGSVLPPYALKQPLNCWNCRAHHVIGFLSLRDNSPQIMYSNI